MLTANGYTWTNADETHDAYERIQLAMTPVIVRKPECQRSRGKASNCGRTTGYLVMTRAELGGKFAWLAYSQELVVFKDDGMGVPLYYHPIAFCVECEGAVAGYQDGLRRAQVREEVFAKVDKGPYTPEMAERYKKVYGVAYEKGMLAANEAELQHKTKKDKSRYLPDAAKARA